MAGKKKMDWEGAAKADYVRTHGSEPASLDVDDLTPEERRAKRQRLTKAETEALQKFDEQLGDLKREFKRLDIDERDLQLHVFKQRVETSANGARLHFPDISSGIHGEIAVLRNHALVFLGLGPPTWPPPRRVKGKQKSPRPKVFSNRSERVVGVQARFVDEALLISWGRQEGVEHWRVVVKLAHKVLRDSDEPAATHKVRFQGKDLQERKLAVRVYGSDRTGRTVARGEAEISSS